MDPKNRLQNRLRGWFPKEPCLKGIHAKVNSGNKPQLPKAIEPLYNGSAIQSIRPLIVVWILLDAFFSYLIIATAGYFGVDYYPLPVTLWIISGVALSAVLGVKQTQRVVHKLSKDFQYHPGLREVVYSIPIFLLSLPALAVIMLYYPNLTLAAAQQFIISAFALNTATTASRYALFSAYEKKENMIIAQTIKRGGLLVIPQPPSSSDGGYEVRNWTLNNAGGGPE